MPTVMPKPAMFDYLDPAKASVFDTPTHRAVRAAARWLGLDTPEGQVLSTAMPAPLVSIYKNAAERAIGTTAFRESARKLGPSLGAAADWLAERYPRVAAHMRVDPELAPATSGYHASVATPHGRVTEPLSLSFSEKGHAIANDAEARGRNLFAHEATHVAQSLGNRDSNALYNAAQNSVGYYDNPFEVMARLRGDASEEGLRAVPSSWRRMDARGNPAPAGAPLDTVPRLLRRAVRDDPFSASSETISDSLMRRAPSIRSLAKSGGQ